jgi:LCP family protein required for cell wall assembly
MLCSTQTLEGAWLLEMNKNENECSGQEKDSCKCTEDDVNTEDLNIEEDFDLTKWIDDVVDENVPLDEELALAQEEEQILSDISASIGKQIQEELDTSDDVKQKRNIPLWVKIVGGTLGTFLLVCILLIITPGGRNFLWNTAVNIAYGRMKYNDGAEVVQQTVIDDVEEDALKNQITDTPVSWDTRHAEDGARQEEGIINVLLLGEEAIDSGGGRGRTDIMIIATMNTKDKKLKLTSLMRDLLVQIPGNKDNKLNAAYEIGGIPLLYETIELNFDVKLDGYVRVGFDDFESVINKLGGVNITLTESEARYLNTTNYISKPQYRKVVPGLQTLNGNQALGYCRVRYVSTNNHERDDYGRTSRHRVVLNAIFDKYKSKSLPELSLLLYDILPLISTDITKNEFETYLKVAVNMGLSEIEDIRIPADNTFEEGYARKMAVLIPDLEANIKVLHEFIFGSVEE